MIISSNQLAKNTLFLYVRMAVVLVVSLFMTRIVLSNLGIEDYGIYNVVGSIVSLFSFLKIAITSANYRYLAVAIGRNDKEKLAATIKCAIILCLCIALIVILLGETLGLYYIYNYLNVSAERFKASIYTFQISLATGVVSTLYMPFYSDVISHERMDFFAYLSIVEVICKVVIAIAIAYSPIDRMIFYAFLLLLMHIFIYISYFLFCYYKFEEVRIFRETVFDVNLFKRMTSFSGWTLFVAVADLFVSQGLNIIINFFYSPVVNAARGIAVQVQSAVDSFRGNLQTALNPQITKRYASENLDGMFYLMSCSARFSVFVMLGISFPIFFSSNMLLSLWLEEVPSYTASFMVLVLIACIIDGISNPYVVAVSSTGNVKKFQSFVGMTKLMTLPICYFTALLFSSPVAMFIAYVFCTIAVVIVRVLLSSRVVGIGFHFTFCDIIKPIFVVIVMGLLINLLLSYIIKIDSLISIIIFYFLSIFFFSLSCYAVGLKTYERNLVKIYVKKIIRLNK